MIKDLTISVDDNIAALGSCSAGSKMLENFKPLFTATAIERLIECGVKIGEKSDVSEFGLGFNPPCKYDTRISVDANAEPRITAYRDGKICYKPSYGVISRYGIVSTVASSETISISGSNLDIITSLAEIMSGPDPRDGTLTGKKLSFTKDSNIKGKRIAVIAEHFETKKYIKLLNNAMSDFRTAVAFVEKISVPEVKVVQAVYLTMIGAEVCNNLSKYDGVKYGYRSPNAKTLEEIYIMSRSEAFGLGAKAYILLGSEILSKENYEKYYVKALKIRRLLKNKFDEIYKNFDAVLLPIDGDELSSLLGQPSIVINGVQLMANNFEDNKLINIARGLIV